MDIEFSSSVNLLEKDMSRPSVITKNKTRRTRANDSFLTNDVRLKQTVISLISSSLSAYLMQQL